MNKSKLHFNSENLSDTLTTVLRSAFSDNLPDSIQTYLKSIAQSSDRPSGANLFTGSDVDITQFFFSDNPDDNFANTFTRFSRWTSAISFRASEADRAVPAQHDRHAEGLDFSPQLLVLMF